MRFAILVTVLWACNSTGGVSWGFFGHQRITSHAIYLLPPGLMGFYKDHKESLVRQSVNPDKRRYILSDEGPRHFIDLEHYGDVLKPGKPLGFQEIKQLIPEDSILEYGMVPWQILLTYRKLEWAMKKGQTNKILRYSADLSHYISDCHVPLHTTENYNGQLTGQKGIHGLWESRLPELFFHQYDLLIGQARFIDDPLAEVWDTMWESHRMVDSVLHMESRLTHELGIHRKFSFTRRSRNLVKTHSQDFCIRYRKLLGGQVERRFRSSVQMVADFWYTSWINAGQPVLR